MIEPGTVLSLHYPCHTHVRWVNEAKRVEREIEVIRIRDLVTDPLSVDEFLRRPFVARSRWLAFSRDLRKKTFRQFYLGSADEFLAPQTMRLALYEPSACRPVELLGREFQPTVRDRMLMVRMIKRWNSLSHGDLQLRVCCDDLRIYT